MKKEAKKATQDNRLVQASYYMTLVEKRVILLAINKANKGNFKDVEITAEDYANVFEDSKAYRDMREAVKRLWDRTIFNLDGHKDRMTRWAYDVKFDEESKSIRLSFPESLIPYLHDLKSKFTTYNLDKISAIGSGFSIRLYELLMQFRSTGELHISLENLKSAFGVADSYPRFVDFKRRCLKIAVKELNEKSDFQIIFKENRKRNKLETISFYFKQKNQLNFKF